MKISQYVRGGPNEKYGYSLFALFIFELYVLYRAFCSMYSYHSYYTRDVAEIRGKVLINLACSIGTCNSYKIWQCSGRSTNCFTALKFSVINNFHWTLLFSLI